MYKIGFIGGGNMASAIVKGLISQNEFTHDDVIVSVKQAESLSRIEKTLQVHATRNNLEVVKNSNIIVLAVKPHLIGSVLSETAHLFTDTQIIISIAAGVTLDQLENQIPKGKIFRAMPNTPAAVNAGMTSICSNIQVSDTSYETVKRIFNAIGASAVIEERLMHAAIAVHGSSPAYVYMMIEAMGDAGVLLGLPRQEAYRMAAQTVMGSAKMFLDLDLHPGALKDQVTSPGGTTIEAVSTLESNGFRNALIEAMKAAANKSIQMSS
ncbi:pyrroline-5-carboxylate reductase [Fusibacter tunisiensis]|uniref:Pyrroline-5-carboxylate reductase n=1 Tax=Fusibacter tunisiensis TaxID=1008308 RepID=A0ABS2MTA8_9FIRM|nr:pyrroline-5-carboxylate reductase [Fusibacter tunisiensis]MBM7562585.1 pyrroline-5-carboxylate reductase [Fusibacter tunisiensis]